MKNNNIKTALPFLIGVIALGIGAATQPDTPVRNSPFFWICVVAFSFGAWAMWSGMIKSINELNK